MLIEHFRKHVAPLLGGQAKAMVVTGSRKEAVRWQLAIRRYIQEHRYAINTLVAFSGEVLDPESFAEPVTEFSRDLNPGLNGKEIRKAFKEGDYAILLVANKFQTGFDEPLLCGLYVDKRLGGVQAVQTLSRLNRAHPGKSETFVVDFVNDPEEILAAFKQYHASAELTDVTNPEIILDLRAKLDGQGYYDSFEVDRGEEVVIARAGQPVATLVAYRPPRRKIAPPGCMKGRDWQMADDFDAPIDELFSLLGDEPMSATDADVRRAALETAQVEPLARRVAESDPAEYLDKKAGGAPR